VPFIKPEKKTNKTKRTAQIHKNVRQTKNKYGWTEEYKRSTGTKTLNPKKHSSFTDWRRNQFKDVTGPLTTSKSFHTWLAAETH
jgi:hypothetical protein